MDIKDWDDKVNENDQCTCHECGKWVDFIDAVPHYDYLYCWECAEELGL